MKRIHSKTLSAHGGPSSLGACQEQSVEPGSTADGNQAPKCSTSQNLPSKCSTQGMELRNEGQAGLARWRCNEPRMKDTVAELYSEHSELGKKQQIDLFLHFLKKRRNPHPNQGPKAPTALEGSFAPTRAIWAQMHWPCAG